ncbi:MAG TPA: protein kinase [Gemmatimonadales bacterium]|jgi:serine/threonine-protein kinase
MSLQEDLQAALGAGYAVERELGGGGMSHLFVARDKSLDRLVVVKVVAVFASARHSIDRFRREVALAASLQHPHIVSVLGAGDVAGVPYFIMPYVESESLRKRLDASGAMPLREALPILRDVARACAYAHERGVVHRDIKPDNVLLAGGSAVITDFGIAKALATTTGEQPAAPLTQEGVTVGTPGYMAPEQVAGDPSTDHRADIYAFGVLAYEMLTGRAPFYGLTPHELMTAQLSRPAPPISDQKPDLPGGIVRLVMQCLDQNPAHRPQSAAQIVQMLDDPGIVSGTQRIPVLSAPARRKRAAMMVLGAAAAVTLVAVALVFTRGRASAAPARSVAVMPLVNSNGDSATAYFADGLTDEITLALSRLPGLQVASRSATAPYRGKTTPPREVGRALNVATILEGSVQASGGKLRLFAQLTDAQNGIALWSQRFDGDMRDVFALQDSLAAKVTEALRSRFGGVAQPAGPRGSAGTSDVAAYDLFLRGRYEFQRRTLPSLREAIKDFQAALARDSGFARAYAGLADAWAVLPLYGAIDPDSAHVIAIVNADKAVALDSTLADALAARGNLYMHLWRWSDAKRDLIRATQLDSTDVNAWQWLGEWQLYNGHYADAERAMAKAVTLDPQSPTLQAIHGVTLISAGRGAEAVAAEQRAVAMDSTSPVAQLMNGAVLLCSGRLDDAIGALTTARRIGGDAEPVLSLLGYAWAKSSQRAHATTMRDSIMRRATTPGATGILAHILLGQGDTAQALTWLEWSAGAHDQIFVSEPFACPIWDPLRGSERFKAVMKKVGIGS